MASLASLSLGKSLIVLFSECNNSIRLEEEEEEEEEGEEISFHCLVLRSKAEAKSKVDHQYMKF